jgi:hypothetical protein
VLKRFQDAVYGENTLRLMAEMERVAKSSR